MQWDDDDITSFSQNQHAATISLCRQAIQFVVNDLISDRFLFPEDATGHITTTGVQTYSLASDFVRFRGSRPWLFELTGAIGTDATSQYLDEYPGGELVLQKEVPAYTSETGTPQWFYFTADRTIGIYPIGTGSVYRYEYQKDVMPESESDSLPVYSDAQGYALCDMAARVFQFLFATQPVDGLYKDSIYLGGKTAVMALARKRDPIGRYGFKYG